MAGLFAKAATVKAPEKKSRKPEAETVEMSGLERHAALCAAIKALTALKDAEEANLKDFASGYFVATGCERKDRPANFKGIDGDAEASVQLKLRASTSPLSDEDQALLTKDKIPFGEIVSQEEAFLINPAYTNNMKYLDQIEQALEAAEVVLPDDFFQRQEKVAKQVATEDSLKAIFKKTAPVARKLLSVVGCIAHKPTLEGDCFAKLDAILNSATAEDAEPVAA